MKNKKFAIATVTLYLGIMISVSVDAQPINDISDLQKQPLLSVKEKIHYKQTFNNNNRIFGMGLCYGISINCDIKQGKGRNQHLVGLINADLSIRNQDPIFSGFIGSILTYFLKIIDLQTDKIFTKETLPVYLYINNFRGIGYIDDYYEPWGPTHAIFFLYGTADYIN